MVKKLKRICIIGTGIGHELAPKITDVDDETELWGCNWVVITHDLHKMFQLHSELFMEDDKVKKHLERVEELKIPIMMQDHFESIPRSVKYPLEEMIEKFDCDFFTCSIDYMLAYAIYLDVKEIDLYGITMIIDSEYMFERPGVHYWIGIARGKGIKVTVHGKESSILKCYGLKLYGYNIRQIEREHFCVNLIRNQ